MKKNVFGSIVAGAVTGLFVSSYAFGQGTTKPAAVPAGHEKPTTGDHHCQNACKGKSECHTATTSCAGQNACKGKGWLKAANEAECKKKGGTWAVAKK